MINRETPKRRRRFEYLSRDRPADLMVLNTARRCVGPTRKQVGNRVPHHAGMAKRCTQLRNSTMAQENSTEAACSMIEQ